VVDCALSILSFSFLLILFIRYPFLSSGYPS
jgi:hypothetical protein